MDDRLERATLIKFAGLALGIVLGGLFGPIVFLPLGLGIATAATMGSFCAAVLGYLAAAGILFLERWRRDHELELAADAVRMEAGLPQSIVIKVKEGRVTLSGEVDNTAERHRAEKVISTLPGIKGITNRIHVRPSGGGPAASPEEIRRRIQDNLVHQAEQDAHAIRVSLNDSHVVLEGTVHSWAEAFEAEDVAWDIPGVVEVENRLEIAT